MQLFFAPDIDTDPVLPEEEARHAVGVLRLRAGDMISIVDGRGGFYRAELVQADIRKCQVRILEQKRDFGKRHHYLHIACAPTKNIDRYEWFLEKATEMGIDEITPLLCHRSERDTVKTERLNKILVSAMKQSVKAYLPRLNEMSSFKELIRTDFGGRKYLAHCQPGEKSLLKDVYVKGQDALVLVGPEGDFTDEEVKAAAASGFIQVSLGPSRLRTETAALAACHTINLINQ
ncbi:MAG: 16S rRNA (uracil(1498)-N(3))-methyltransferase [Bacteroidota bacterium]